MFQESQDGGCEQVLTVSSNLCLEISGAPGSTRCGCAEVGRMLSMSSEV